MRWQKLRVMWVWTVLVIVVAACGEPTPPITTCEASATIEPHCGFQNPEDLALLPDGRTVIASQYGAMDGRKPGNLAVFDVTQPAAHVRFRAEDAAAQADPWGDPACPGPPSAAFGPHGIDLARRADGRLQLLVVNHAGREAIEFFEVTPAGVETRFTWRGCAELPDDMYVNDVVHTPEGGLLTTHMMSRSGGRTGLLKAGLFGSNVGWVLAWSPPDRWTKVEGTDAPFPNGLELSADGRHVYVNVYMAGEVRKVDVETGETVATASVPSPDNSTWSSDGRTLLVASHTAGMRDSMACMELAEGSCPMAFQIVALDGETLESRVVFEHEGAPMGGATVALQVRDDLWLGTFAGDRVARVVGGASSAHD